MPTYSYVCTECGNRFDVMQTFTDNALTSCERCSGRLRKLFSAVGVVFKGSGFYHNDSREARKAATNGSGKPSSSAGSDGKSSSGENAGSEKLTTAGDKASKTSAAAAASTSS